MQINKILETISHIVNSPKLVNPVSIPYPNHIFLDSEQQSRRKSFFPQTLILFLLRNRIDHKKYQWYSFRNFKRMDGD